MRNSKILFLLLLPLPFLSHSLVQAQAGYIDTSYYQGVGIDYKCTGGLVLPDSSVIVIGRFVYVNERLINGIAKLKSDGNLDYSFNPGTGADEHVNQVVRQTDGKLIIAGDFKTFNGDSVYHIARLNPDGSRDYTFNTGSGFTSSGTIYSLYLQPDGKILAGGIFNGYNGTAANYIIRLNTDGTVDNTFNTGSGFNGYVYSIDRQPNGKYIVAGHFTSFNNDTTIIRITRLNSDGSLDPSFHVGYGFDNIVTTARIQPNGKIVAVGFFTLYDSVSRSRIVRLNTDGSIDYSYNVGSGFNSNINDLTFQPDGKVLATGNFTKYNGSNINRIIRIDTLGGKDNTFAPGSGPNISCNAVFLNPDGKIYLGGFFTQVDSFVRFRFARLLATGKVDHTFFLESKLNAQSRDVETQSTGKAIVVGQFTRYNQIMANRIVRLNADGSVDLTFKSGTGANNTVRTVKVLPNDKILIGGDFTNYNGKAMNRMARLNADGTLDSTFNIGSGVNATVYKITADSSGKIYVGGNFTIYAGDTVNRMVRLNTNGSRDVSFNTGTGFNKYVYDIALSSNGKILACGSFTTYNAVSHNRIIRLNTDGSADNSFVSGVGANNIVYSISLADSGRLLIGGSFTKYNNVAKNRVARLEQDGSLSSSFTASVTNGVVYDIVQVKKGTLIGGTFTTVNGTSKPRIAFLDQNGSSTGTTFYTGTGASAGINNFFVDGTQRVVYVSGDFTTLQSHLYNRFARLRNSDIYLTKVAAVLCPGAITKVYFRKMQPFNTGNTFTFQLSDSTGSFTSATNIGASANISAGNDSTTIYLPNNLPSGSKYRIRIISTNSIDTSNASDFIVISSPQPPVVIANGATTFCSGDSVILSVAEGNTFLWSTGATTSHILVKQSGSYWVTVNNNNCIATSTPVVTMALSAPDSTIHISATSLCNGGSVKLQAAPNLIYQWSVGPTTPSITISQSGIYSLTVTDSIGCHSSNTLNLDMNAYFNTLITPDSSISICDGDSITLASISGVTYLWSNQQTSQNIVVNSSGNYSVTISDGICQLSGGPVSVTIKPLPAISFSLPADTFCANGNSISLVGSPSGGQFAGNGVSASTFNPTGLGNSTAVVTYSYTGANGCVAETADSAFIAICTGLAELSNNHLLLFPNPATDRVFLYHEYPEAEPIRIFSAFGNKMIEFRSSDSRNTQEIDISSLAQGNYFMTVGKHRLSFTKLTR